MYDQVVKMLADRGVTLQDVAELVQEIQSCYYDNLTVAECLDAVRAVLSKREVQNAVMTGIVLDTLAERGQVPEPLARIILTDDCLFGVDEILALAITNVYGSIGLTNFGYLDKLKPGILRRLNDDKDQKCNTFLDDLVAGLAAASAARIAHRYVSSHK